MRVGDPEAMCVCDVYPSWDGSSVNHDKKHRDGVRTMRIKLTNIRPFQSDANVELAALDVENDAEETFNVLVTAGSAAILESILESGEVTDVPDWLLLPFPLFDPVDA